MLAKRLLWCPELELQNDCLPDPICLASIADALRAAIVRPARSPRQPLRGRPRGGDFRFLDTCLLGGLSPLADDEAFIQQMHRLQDAALAELRGDAGRTAEVLEQSVVDNVLDEVERVSYDSQLQEIIAPPTRGERELPTTWADVWRSSPNCRLPSAPVERNTSESVAARWSLVRGPVLESYPAKEAKPVVSLVERALEEADIVLLNECVPALERTVDRKAPLEPGRFVAPEQEDVLDVFNESRDSIRITAMGRSGLRGVLADIESKRQKAGITFGSLSDPQCTEVLKAVAAWSELKRNKGVKEEARRQLPVLAQYLGFELLPTDGHAVTVKASKADWLHASGSITPAGDRARPIPLYGSKSNNRYDRRLPLGATPGMRLATGTGDSRSWASRIGPWSCSTSAI